MKNITVKDLISSGKYGAFADYFWTYITDDHLNNTLDVYGYEKTGMELGLKRCQELASGDGKAGKSYIHSIYTRHEIYKCHELQEARLIYFPCEKQGLHIGSSDKSSDIKPASCKNVNTSSPYALVIPGGGFARQWALIEGFSIAAKLNEMGIPAFVLFYRTSQRGVIKKALNDMYRAVSYIQDNADQFKVSKDRYILGGFSAGATLAGEMASDNLGWKVNNLPKPEMIFLGYPAQRMDFFYKIWKESPEDSPAKESMEDFLMRLTADDITMQALEPYNLQSHLSKEICPPLYITANEDDPTVPFINSLSLYEACCAKGIPVRTSFGLTGGHSYGPGNGLEVDGWLNDAISTWHDLQEKSNHY